MNWVSYDGIWVGSSKSCLNQCFSYWNLVSYSQCKIFQVLDNSIFKDCYDSLPFCHQETLLSCWMLAWAYSRRCSLTSCQPAAVIWVWDLASWLGTASHLTGFLHWQGECSSTLLWQTWSVCAEDSEVHAWYIVGWLSCIDRNVMTVLFMYAITKIKHQKSKISLISVLLSFQKWMRWVVKKRTQAADASYSPLPSRMPAF